MKTFRELGLSREFVSVLEKAKIITPSEIQEKTIPLVLAGKDVIGGSATGSGKTLAFASAIIENLKPNKRVQALILTPTRELAEQVATSITNFSKHKKLKVLSIYGGVNIENQIRNLRKTDIVVGTPGRILDHLNRGTLSLGEVNFLVLDEVDRMFDMGFKFDVEKILRECPTKRQTMLFSATISQDIDYLANKYTKNPEEVSVKSHVDASKLKQVFYDVPDGLKFSLLVHLLKKEKSKLVMVFCGTRRNVDFITKNLENLGINANAIHGGLNQNQRNRALGEFNSDKGITVLVCTDIAARGLDIPGISHVYNYDISKTSTEYIHRIGRTARAGKEGIAISILCSRDYENFSAVTRDEKLKITEIKLPFIERVNIIPEKRSFGRRSREGRNPRQRNFPQRRTSPGGPRTGNNSSRGNSRDRDSSRGRDHTRGRSSGPSRGRDFSRGRSSGPSRGRDNSRPPSRSRPSSHRPRNNNSRRPSNSRPGRNFKRR